MLAVIDELAKSGQSGSLQSSTVLHRTLQRAGLQRSPENEQAVLTQYGELFRTGYLAWGLDFSNPDPPFFHLTEQGRRALAHLSSDPTNVGGYLARLDQLSGISPITRSYIAEALNCFVGDLNKAAAVMTGAAAESAVIDLRDVVVRRLLDLGKSAPRDLEDWRALRIMIGLKVVFDQRKAALPNKLRESYEAYWPAFTQQIRAARNEAGHPASIDSVQQETVHASLLIFPELLKLVAELSAWAHTQMAE